MSSILLQKSKIENFSKFFLKKLNTKKIGPSGAPGLASASPWRAKVSQCRKTERVDPLRFFNIHSVAKHEKIEEKKIFIFGKKSHNAEKKLKGGTLWDFSTSILSQNIKKMQGEPFEEKKFRRKKFRKKMSRSAEKNERGESLVSPGMVWYAGKQEKPFWFSSLDQIVHFGPIIFCRTFKNYFGQFVWIEKKSHYNSRVSLHEAPTKNVPTTFFECCWRRYCQNTFGHFLVI